MADAPFDVFISHNSKDNAVAKELKQALVAYSVHAWLDDDELQPGIPWQRDLENGIRDAASVMVLVGADGIGPWEDEEMRAALCLAVKNGCSVVPVLLPGAQKQADLPLFLANRTWVDMREGIGSGDSLARLVWGITGKKPRPS